ncbi:type IV secretion system protein [Novosphingobium mangrovi (ex Huang et al. 2023)]|uniref:Type IV secretion system protein n=1 Tax=Novosphingobium mangrovi (ex Huang et al. 2023) TaxID=2976432 RepID=A0ABT2I6N3_9SPHN|nr:type IV secretion system protein [Novosphingobium mangrovi (ex Huang et al. 2023)]MCT2400258.1 type IV secretion system protein [Novosphingobium mangrovi (ex Huang et al. 2023)]
MSSACDQLTQVASAGVAPALRAVDCVANEMAASAFGRLFGAGGAMAPVLTILLTLYIAFFAYSLLTGRSTLGVSALTPRMLRLGVVLTFATSWIAYQSVVWNLALGGPDWIAAQLMGVKGSATTIFGDRIDIVFAAIADVATNGAAQGSGGGAKDAASASGMITPETIMWLGALLLLLGTVGVLLTARIALAVLLAVGPIFVVLALFNGTRGLTAGWLRGVALTAITPLFVVLGGGITLELLVPIISGLVQSANMGEIDGRAAMAFFLVAAVHVALMIMVVKVASTMAGGWRVFGLAGEERDSASRGGQGAFAPTGYAAAPAPAPAAQQSRASGVASAGATAMVETSSQDSHSGTRVSERRTVVTQVSGGGLEPLRSGDNAARTRGIGSRFRSASNDTGRMPAKEKIQ